MCNLYRITTNQQAIRDFVAATHDSIGNLEPSMDVYPDRPAPVVRNTDGGRELASLTSASVRWPGRPSSASACCVSRVVKPRLCAVRR